MESKPTDPMEDIMRMVGHYPEILKNLGRFAGMVYGGETDHFSQAIARVAQEMQGNFVNVANTISHGLREAQLSPV